MELRFLSNAVARHRALIVALLVLGIVAGTGLALHSGHEYRARASLIVNPLSTSLPGSQAFEDPDRFVAGQIDIIQSDALAAAVARQFPSETTLSVQNSVTAVQRGKSDVIDIFAVRSSPQRAADLANAVANSFVAQHSTVVKALQAESTSLVAELATIQQQLTVIDTNLAVNPRSGGDLAAQESLVGQYNVLLNTKSSVDSSEQIQAAAVNVFDRAIPPPSPISRHVPVKVAAGAAGGLALGIVIALALAVWRPRLASRDDVEELLGSPIRAELPSESRLQKGGLRVRATGNDSGDSFVAAYPGSRFAEEIRMACVFVESAPSGRRMKTVLVTSAAAGAGRTTVANAMAVVLARSGRTVSLVEFDEDQGGADPLGEDSPRSRARVVSPSPYTGNGSGHVESGRQPEPARLAAAVLEAVKDDPSASTTSDLPVELSASPTRLPPQVRGVDVADWLRHFEADDPTSDLLLIDAGPLRDRSSAVAFAQAVDAIVLVIPLPHEQRDALDVTLRSSLGSSGAVLIPVVNRPPRPGRRRRRPTS